MMSFAAVNCESQFQTRKVKSNDVSRDVLQLASLSRARSLRGLQYPTYGTPRPRATSSTHLAAEVLNQGRITALSTKAVL